MENMNLPTLTGYLVLAISIYKLALNTIALVLNFVSRRTENKTDDAIARLINRMARLSKSTIDLIK